MIWFFQRTPHVVVLATLLVSFYLYATEESMIATIGGFTLHVTDLLFAIAACYCVVGAFIRWHLSLEVVLLMLCGLLIISFVRGVVTWGYAPAGVQFRQVAVFSSLVTFVYFWARQLDADWIFKAIIVLGWGIVALSAARLVFGLTLFLLQDRDVSYEFRTLNSEAALMLGEAALIALNGMLYPPQGARRLWYGGTFAAFMVSLFISDQRTSIFATLAGLAVIAVSVPGRFRPILVGAGILLLAITLVITGVMWIEIGDDVIDYLPHSINMIILGSETYGARQLLWQNYLDAYSQWPIFEQMFGQPYGSSFGIYLQSSDSAVTISPHNGYLALLINVGAIGVFLFAYVLIVGIAKGIIVLATKKQPNMRYVRLSVAILASHAVYSYGYQLGNDQGLLLALAVYIIVKSSASRHALSLDRAAPVRRHINLAQLRHRG